MPCQDGESIRIRTGFEAVVAHQTSDTFACIAERDGQVIDVDNDLKIVRIAYDEKPPKPQGSMDVHLTIGDLERRHKTGDALFTTVNAKTLQKMQVGSLQLVNKKFLFKFVEAIPFDSLGKVPETSALTNAEKAALEKEDWVYYLRLMPFKIDPAQSVDVFQFGDKYTTISGSYLRQIIVLNVKKGDRVKRGDVIAYNSGFFEPEPGTRQVNWKHGVVGTVAFMDRSETYEDSCEISKEFGQRLSTSPGHQRIIEVTNNTVLHEVVSVGDHVETEDYLAIMEDGDLDALASTDDPAMLDMIASLNRKMPKAKYHGVVARVEIYHACDFADLHPSLQKIARRNAQQRRAVFNAYQNTMKANNVTPPQKVPIGTKYLGVEFADETKVAIFVIISEDLGCVPGDKLVLAAQAKTTIGNVVEQPTTTASGVPVDMVFSASGVANRLLSSHLILGIGESVLEKLEQNVVTAYFKD